jgi:GNAT superfamily N-acetyltransferase
VTDTSEPVYVEPAARYTSSIVLAVVVAAGFTVDCVRAGHVVHVLGWVIGGVAIVGVNLLIVRAARSFRTVTVTAGEIRVGEQWVARDVVAGIDDSDGQGHVLGQTPYTNLPRGVPGLRLRLRNGEIAIVPTRHPDRLAGVLGLAAPVDQVRPASAADLDTLPLIVQRAWTLYRVAGLDVPPQPTTADELRSADAVLVIGTPPSGFVQLDRRDDIAQLSMIAVLPARMRAGLGSVLLAAACDEARARGCTRIEARVDATAPWQVAFFAARGFTGNDGLLRRDLP